MSDYVLAGIVTYHPDVVLLEKNIRAAAEQADRVVIVDNHSANIQEIENICRANDVLLVKNQSNQGIAKAMNQIFQVAVERECQWVLTLDQDSVLPEGFVERSREIQKGKPELKIGIIAPRVYDVNMDFYWKAGHAEYDSYVGACISSGSFIQVKMYQKIGGFDEMLFIDLVDTDFCVRAGLAGYKILVLHNYVLKHSIGSGKMKKIFGIKIPVMHHSAERKYYMARNRVLYARRYAKFKGTYKSFVVLYIIYMLGSTVLFERQKIKKCLYIMKGIIAGLAVKKSIVREIVQKDCFKDHQTLGGQAVL